MKQSDHDRAVEIIAVLDQIRPILAGRGPDVQSAIIANLLAIHLAGYSKDAHDDILAIIIELTKDMVEIEIHDLFGPAGHPQDRH